MAPTMTTAALAVAVVAALLAPAAVAAEDSSAGAPAPCLGGRACPRVACLHSLSRPGVFVSWLSPIGQAV